MRIYIPSKSRSGKQITWSYIPEALRKRVDIVVPESQADEYRAAGYPVLETPGDMRIPETRNYIVDHHLKNYDNPKLIMFDDDLRFFVRRKDHPGRFVQMSPPDKQMIDMVSRINDALDKYPHVGVCPREQGHRFPPYETHLVRMTRVLAYDAKVLREIEADFARLPLMEDFDVALQVLRKGYATSMITEYAQGQNGSNQPGGCSTYRDAEMQKQAAEGLAALHDPFVKTTERKTKSGWFEGGVRTDARIYWQYAYEDGLKYRTKMTEEPEEPEETEDLEE